MEKQLTPITNGMLVIVGAKPSNFDDKIRNHPQVVMWNSQEEHWSNKELPQNTKAVFFTRWVGHTEFGRIMSQARKRHITVFNHEGTGIIAKQVKELLGLAPRMVDLPEIHGRDTETEEETIVTPIPTKRESPNKGMGKLKPLIPFLDHSKTHVENAKILMVKARELGIETTEGSLAMLSSTQRRFGTNAVPYSVKYQKPERKPKVVKTQNKQLDVTIQMFDTIIKELSDMREFLIATVEENNTLKTRLDTLKRALTGE